MATRTTAFRPETKVHTITTTVPAAGGDYDLEFPAGLYYVAIGVKANITGTTTVVSVTPLVGVNSDAEGVDFKLLEPDDTSVINNITLAAGASSRYAIPLHLNSAFGGINHLQLFKDGLRITLAKGTAVEGELLEIQVVMTRVG